MAQDFNTPKPDHYPDNDYFDHAVISYDFEVGGKQATLGFIQPGFNDVFPVSEGGEEITLTNPVDGTELLIEELDTEGSVTSSHQLTQEGDSVSVPEGISMRVSTGKAIVEYVCVYPGKDVK